MSSKPKFLNPSLIIGCSLSVLVLALILSLSLLYRMSFLEKALSWINQNNKQNSPQESPPFLLLNSNSLLGLSNPSNPELKVVKKINVIATAYSSTPWETQGDPFITASGAWVRDGIIANNLLPLGTKVKIPEIYGDKIFVVEDRMNKNKGKYQIDIWFPDHWQALDFGAKRTYIEVFEG